jgi:hypothetical protein
MDAAGTNKSITRQELQTYNAGTLTTDVKVLDLSATWNAGAVTFTAIKLNVTSTASAGPSLLLDLQVGGASKFKVDKDGQAAAGNMWYGISTINNFISYNTFCLQKDTVFGWNSVARGDSLGLDLTFYRDAADILAQRRTTNAQTFRLYNTFTDASNYERLGINWGSNIVSIKPEAAGTGTVRVLHISGLPTSNPGPGILWNNGGTPAIGT